MAVLKRVSRVTGFSKQALVAHAAGLRYATKTLGSLAEDAAHAAAGAYGAVINALLDTLLEAAMRYCQGGGGVLVLCLCTRRPCAKHPRNRHSRCTKTTQAAA